ncbi:MAG: protein arginine kinase [Planctomycetota bacterium]|nr:MAG: protein arginine kinase [Planctomycetota bacterium]
MTKVTLDDLVFRRGEWLRGEGPESVIVVSTRIRLARNLADYAFISRASDADRKQIRDRVVETVMASELGDRVFCVDVEELSELDRQFLVERHLISRELAEMKGPRAVIIDHDERFSIMVNEEDHIRIQVMQSGLNLAAAWELAAQIDDVLESGLTYAFDDELGFLTACPTNVGTGMRVSVMMHLPAVVIARQMENILRSLQKIDLVVRGLYGEGSQAMGDFYQVSNQVTLGASEQELLDKVGDVVPTIIGYENKARAFLVEQNEENLQDRVSRALGILCTAKTISSEETMHLLSSVRMGIALGLIDKYDIPTINDLFLQTQPAHLQKVYGQELDSADRNIERANFLRKHLAGEEAV